MNIIFKNNKGKIEITNEEIEKVNKSLFLADFKYEYKTGSEKYKNVKNGILGEIIAREYLKRNNYSIDESYKEGYTKNGFNYGDIKIDNKKILVTTKVFSRQIKEHLNKCPEDYAAFIKESQIEEYLRPNVNMCLIFIIDNGTDNYYFKIIGFISGFDLRLSMLKGQTRLYKKGSYFSNVKMCYNNYVVPITKLKDKPKL